MTLPLCQDVLHARPQEVGEVRTGVRRQSQPVAELPDAAIFQDQDSVGALNCVETVRDDDAGPVCQEQVDRALDELLGRRVEPR